MLHDDLQNVVKFVPFFQIVRREASVRLKEMLNKLSTITDQLLFSFIIITGSVDCQLSAATAILI